MTLRRGPRVAVLLLLLTALAGCGDDSDTATPGPTVTVTETAPPSGPTVAPTTADVGTPPVSSGAPTEVTSVASPTIASVTPGPTVDVSQPPRTYDEALAHFDAVGGEPVAERRFVTPSGNLYCVLRDEAIPPSCELGEGTIRDPAACPGAGPTVFVGRIEFQDGHATAICNSDTIRIPGAPTLDYTDAARVGDIECLSEKIGVTCINLDRTDGFFLRKGQYVLFNAG